jgi:hypothetical protein
MKERRASARIPANVEATYQRGRDEGRPRSALTQDVSLGGMRMISTEPLEPGDPISISFALPEAGSVTLQGVVVWSRQTERAGRPGYECGLRWTEIGPIAQARLNAFVIGATRPQISHRVGQSSVALQSVIRWPRVALLSLIVMGFLVMVLFYWLEWYRLFIENQALHQQVSVYRAILNTK